MTFSELVVPKHSIMTPGPVEADPRVLQAMANPIIGQFDPALLHMMDETKELLKYVFKTNNKEAFPVSGTARSGAEAVLNSIIEPGDKVLVPSFGRFGYLLAEMVERSGAEMKLLEQEWGKVYDPQELIKEIKAFGPKVVAIVHGESSTGALQPLEEIGKFCRENDILFVVDCVPTLGGVEFKTDEWNIDAAISGTQKCLAIPTGYSPLTYNDRVGKILEERKKIEMGLDLKSENPRRIQSNYFDLSQIQEYWGPSRLNHHTEPTTLLYGLREGLRLIKEEGIDNRIKRHTIHGEALVKGIQAAGVKIFNDLDTKMPVVTLVETPEGVDEAKIRATMVNDFGIEIAGGFGPLAGKTFRIGNMGYGCRKDNILGCLAALEATLVYHGAKGINVGDGVQAAMEYYNSLGNDQPSV